MTASTEYSDGIKDQKRGQTIPPETCPLIDKVLEGISDALREVPGTGRYGRNRVDTYEEAMERLSAIETALYGLDSTLETIRRHNATLRELGLEWYETALYMAKEADKLAA